MNYLTASISTAVFQVTWIPAVQLAFFLHLFWERTFKDNSYMYLYWLHALADTQALKESQKYTL